MKKRETHKVTFSDGCVKYIDWLDHADKYAEDNDLFVADIESATVNVDLIEGKD